MLIDNNGKQANDNRKIKKETLSTFAINGGKGGLTRQLPTRIFIKSECCYLSYKYLACTKQAIWHFRLVTERNRHRLAFTNQISVRPVIRITWTHHTIIHLRLWSCVTHESHQAEAPDGQLWFNQCFCYSQCILNSRSTIVPCRCSLQLYAMWDCTKPLLLCCSQKSACNNHVKGTIINTYLTWKSTASNAI